MGRTMRERNGLFSRACAFSLLLLLGGAGTAIAEDFTFNVPVALYSMPASYTTGKVSCKCWVEPRTTATGPGSTTPGKPGRVDLAMMNIGAGEKDFSITNGTYVGTIAIRFNAMAGASPASATDWSCILALFDKTANRWSYADALMSGTYNRSKPYLPSDRGYLK
jgi:hypothetical protein